MRLVLIALLAASLAPLPTAASAQPAPQPSAACDRTLSPEEEPTGPDFERRASAKNPCDVADENLAREEAEILYAKPAAAQAPRQAWDRKAAPQFLKLITGRFDLQPTELALMNRTGFVVPARLEQRSYAHAYHEIFQSQLPVYITADSIFHAIFASYQSIAEKLEGARLAPMLSQALDDMHATLATAAPDYPADVVRDLDLYLVVARRLILEPYTMEGKETPLPRSAFGDASVDGEATELVAKANEASDLATVTLFGRPRLIDFTHYAPRGHYLELPPMQRYFRAAMWASRLEFNLISRSSRSSEPGDVPNPEETPREAIAALALADLAARGCAAKLIADMDTAWAVLAGRREDVSVAQLIELRTQVGPLNAPDAFDKLKAAIGDRFQRTTRLHPMPEGSRVLPAIATMLGPRVVADATALMPLVNSAVPNRDRVGVADIAYTFGHDRARAYLADDLKAFPTLDKQLAAARTQLASTPAGDDLYSAWLAAVRALGKAPEGTVPSFLTSDAGADMRMNSIAAAYGQLKHNFVLVAGQPYAEFGCEIPDGYVEPVPAVYEALTGYAARGAKLAALLDPKDGTRVRAYFERVSQVLRVLRVIADDELAGRALTPAQRRWLGMVAELNINRGVDMTGNPPTYTGWYFDLFLKRQEDGMRGADYIADYFTSQEGIAYAGATAPRMGVFVIDAGGPPRAFVGPVARAYQAYGPVGARYTDESARTLTQRDEPWAASYTVAAPAKPSSLQLRYDREKRQLVLTSDKALGPATIKALDHHRVAIESARTTVRKGATRIAIKARKPGGFFIQVGDFRDYVVADAYGEIQSQWGTPPPEPQ